LFSHDKLAFAKKMPNRWHRFCP